MQSTDGPAREQVVQHVHGPPEIQAGHGTGKTTLLLDRFAYLVRQRLAWPYEVLLLTFTRRAATEMRERLQLLLAEDTDDLPILTLHAFARRLLASQPDHKHNPFIIFDPNQAFRVLRRAMVDDPNRPKILLSSDRMATHRLLSATRWGVGQQRDVIQVSALSGKAISRAACRRAGFVLLLPRFQPLGTLRLTPTLPAPSPRSSAACASRPRP